MFLDCGEEFSSIINLKRIFVIAQETIKHNASCPNIDLMLIPFLMENLRREIGRCPTALDKLLFGRNDLGEPKIGNLYFDDILLFMDEYVLGLDVPVDYAA